MRRVAILAFVSVLLWIFALPARAQLSLTPRQAPAPLWWCAPLRQYYPTVQTCPAQWLQVARPPGLSQPPPQAEQASDPHCEAIADKARRDACFVQAGIPIVDCHHPQNADDIGFCRQVSGTAAANQNPPQPSGTASPASPTADPLRQWCTEHTNPATCSDVNFCIEYCVQHSVGRDPAAIAAQLQQEHEAKKRQQEAQAEAAAKFSNAQQRGYQPITFDDFKLDGKELAANNTKLIMHGFYLKLGESEYLFPSILAVASIRETLNTDVGIGLLTDDAQRDIRKYFLDCQNNLVRAQIGCPINVLGHATMCTRTSLLSGSTDLPCLAVEDGWTPTSMPASLQQKPDSTGGLPQAEIDAFRQRIYDCWTPPPGIDPNSNIFVSLKILFKPDGSLAQMPIVVAGPPVGWGPGPALIESAKSALLTCQPFKMLRPEHYEQWKNITVEFNPRDALAQ